MSQSHPAPLRVLFLGPLRDRLGCETTDIPFPLDGAQALLWAELQKRFPALQSSEGILRLARCDEFLPASAALYPGDEVALIPPVSGG
jgi:molybdopterin converting factor small subunit